MPEEGPPTIEAAQARIAAVDPPSYARTRNALDGAVSGLSPYLTHGFVSLDEVARGVAARHALTPSHKFMFELGWRAYFRHVWQHRGAGIFDSLHAGPLPDAAYGRTMPDDVRQGRTGAPVVDQAVRTLYATGLLHNHARLWLASYLVHLRKIHWRCGADWLYGHLLDGDLASNHLSWQWVAGTASRQPYLFNADNVARWAPMAWHSPGSVIDADYDTLVRLARTPVAATADACWAPPAVDEPVRTDTPPGGLEVRAPDAASVDGREVWLVHPWNLGERPADLPPEARVIGVFVADFHRAWPWTARRWRFVGHRMRMLATEIWHGDATAIGDALRAARRVRTLDDLHLAPWLAEWATLVSPASPFPEVDRCCESFSQWWARASRPVRPA